jgi:hypothetical protein
MADEAQAVLKKMKTATARETLLSIPDFSEPFHIHDDASDCQLGSVLMQ